MQTTNFEKHTTNNPISKFFLNNFTAAVIDEIKKIKPQSILDVGAGEGFTLQTLKDKNIGTHLEGIEYMDNAISIAKKIHPHLIIKKGNIYNLPYKDNTFDVVICTEVLEHLDDPQKALKELKRVTKKYCVLTVPNEPYFTVQRIMRGKNILQLGAHPEHLQLWTIKKFTDFVASTMKVIKVRSPFPWTMVIAEK